MLKLEYPQPELENTHTRTFRMPGIFDEFLFAIERSEEVASQHFHSDTYDDDATVANQAPTSTSAAVNMQWLTTHLQRELAYLAETDECVYCRAPYRRRDNIGALRCKFHPAPGYGRSTECCGADKMSPGCTPCDHQPTRVAGRWSMDTVTIAIPLLLARNFAIRDDAIAATNINATVPSKSHVVVKRAQYDQQLPQTMGYAWDG